MNATTYAACAGKGVIRSGLCNFIEDTKRNILGGALDTVQDLVRSTLELILQRPAPRSDGEIAVFRPPTNQPLAGAYRGWTNLGLPLGFMVWVLGVGIALASRFRPEASFAAQGFQIEQNLVRNLVLTLGSWWLGAFILHLANGLILAVAPQGDQLLMGPESSVGSLLAAGGLAALLWTATATVVTILFVAAVLAYFLCLSFMVFLPVFSALMLFSTSGVLRTIGQFGQTGWDIFIRAALFPLPAALVLGAGTFIADGTRGFVEGAIAVGGLAPVAGTLAFAVVMFVTLVTALVASLWMLLGPWAARTAGGVMAGLGGAALYSRGKWKLKALGRNASIPSVGSSTDAGSTAVSSGGSPGSTVARGWEGVSGPGSGPDTAGALGAGSRDVQTGGLTPMEVPTGSRTSAPGTATRSATGASASTGAGTGVSAGTGSPTDPIIVEGQRDLPAGQDYKPGYVSDGEFQSVVPSKGRSREMVVRTHDRFAEAFDSDGDHPGIYLRGETDGKLYDASPVAGEDWGLSVNEQARMSREAVYDARENGGESK